MAHTYGQKGKTLHMRLDWKWSEVNYCVCINVKHNDTHTHCSATFNRGLTTEYRNRYSMLDTRYPLTVNRYRFRVRVAFNEA